jgi:hypothetical protein
MNRKKSDKIHDGSKRVQLPNERQVIVKKLKALWHPDARVWTTTTGIVVEFEILGVLKRVRGETHWETDLASPNMIPNNMSVSEINNLRSVLRMQLQHEDGIESVQEIGLDVIDYVVRKLD